MNEHSPDSTSSSSDRKRFLPETVVRWRHTIVAFLCRDLTFERRVFLFVFAFCLGAVAKIIAVETITMGYQDYTLVSSVVRYDLNAVQQEVLHEGGSMALSPTDTVNVCAP